MSFLILRRVIPERYRDLMSIDTQCGNANFKVPVGQDEDFKKVRGRLFDADSIARDAKVRFFLSPSAQVVNETRGL
jgi:hypothetical protein